MMMSLMQLLATGTSLIAGQDLVGRYRLPRQAVLPHFGSMKNPFASTVSPAGESEPTSAKPMGAAPTEPEASLQRPLPKAEPNRAVAVVDHHPSPGKASSARDWVAWFNPFAVRQKGLLLRPGMRSSPDVGPLQGELSLENVRVVRNDLRGSDLEFVPLRSSRPTRGNEPAPGALGRLTVGATMWSRLTGRLLHTERSHAR